MSERPTRARRAIDPRLVDLDDPQQVLALRRQRGVVVAPRTAFEQFLESRRAENKSPQTVRNYAFVLSLLARHLDGIGRADIWEVTTEDLQGWMRSLRVTPAERTGKPHSIHTIRNYTTHTLACWHWLEEGGLVPPTTRRGVHKPSVQAHEQPDPTCFTDEEVRRLFAACEADGEPGGERLALTMRNRALLAVLLDTGCRRGELVSMTVRGLNLEQLTLRVEQSKTQVREIAMGNERAPRYLRRYLEVGRRILAETSNHPDVTADSGPLWLGRDGYPLRHTGVEKLFQRLEKRAAPFEHGECSPHVCRRWYITRTLQHGVPPMDVARQCGNSLDVILKYYYSATVQEMLARVRQGAPLDPMTREQSLRQNPRGGRRRWDMDA